MRFQAERLLYTMQLPKTTPSGLGDHIACIRVAIQNLAQS